MHAAGDRGSTGPLTSESWPGAGARRLIRALASPLYAGSNRRNFSTRAYNVLVTNVPGPQFPLYLLGRELQELAPVPFLAPERALAVAIMSYNGSVDIGLMGDYDAMADLLLPRAVAYSTGLINFFFRGQIEISLPQEGVFAVADHSSQLVE